MIARSLLAGAALCLAACQPTPPETVAPSRAPGAQPSAPAAPAISAPATLATPGAAIALPSTELPPGPIYVCDVAGTRTPIEFAEKVEALCRKHPEMGPCQYERNACRRGGGRVYTAIGEEVTVTVEAEYDRKVRRVTLQSDGAPAKR